MNRTQLLAYHDETCAKAKALMEAKNHDYTGSAGDDPFGNFTAVEDEGLCSTEVGIMVRMKDKYRRLKSFIQSGSFAVKEESVEDTIQDHINYLILLGAYLKQKRESPRRVVDVDAVTDDKIDAALKDPRRLEQAVKTILGKESTQ